MSRCEEEEDPHGHLTESLEREKKEISHVWIDFLMEMSRFDDGHRLRITASTGCIFV